MLLTLDSSVFVAAVKKAEERHKECKALFDMIVKKEHFAVEPYTVFVETVSAAKRRTGSKEFAEEIKRNFEQITSIHFLEIVKSRAEEASVIATRTGLKGMDSIVVQIAKEMKSTLVSLDDEMIEKAKREVKIKPIEELIK